MIFASDALQARNHRLDIFTRAARQGIHPFRTCRPRHQRFEDVFESQWHRSPGLHHWSKQFIVVDLAETGTAVFILWRISVVFDTERANVLPAGLNIGDRIVIFVIKNVARVIADLHTCLIYFRRDADTIRSRRRLAAMLLDHEHHASVSSHGSQLLQVLDPDLPLPWLYCPEREHKRHSSGG